jgi:pimeloyl-ACP methyl ester carboxylesterase
MHSVSPLSNTFPSAYLPRRPHRSEFITLRGLKLHLLRWGEQVPSTAHEPLLVMLHGWMDVGASFQFLVDALSQERAVLALDWRGFGLSDCSGADSYWIPDYLADLDALLDHFSPEQPVDLLGHSMGGNVAMSYAGVRPQRIRRLVNLEGFGLPDTRPELAPARMSEWLDALKSPQALRPYASLAAVAERLRKNNPRLTPDKAQWLAPHWSREIKGEWHLLADAAHKRPGPQLYRKDEVLAAWQRIQAPTLWVEGDSTDVSKWWGNLYPRSDFEARLAVVPQVQRVLLEDAGHMLHHDQPQILAPILERFLQD